MSETVTLENLTRQSKVVILDHPAFRDKKWGFKRIGQQSLSQQKDGSVTATLVRRSIIGSIRLPARGQATELHPAIANCSQVKRWLAKGEVRIKAEAPQEAKPTKRRRTSSTPDNGESA